eukprot:6306224-Prymnesium_polylepis.1
MAIGACMREACRICVSPTQFKCRLHAPPRRAGRSWTAQPYGGHNCALGHQMMGGWGLARRGQSLPSTG